MVFNRIANGIDDPTCVIANPIFTVWQLDQGRLSIIPYPYMLYLSLLALCLARMTN